MKNSVQKHVIITGANSGIGKAASLQFAAAGHTVIMACRHVKRSQAVQKEIISKTGNNKVVLMELDASSMDSIRQFCQAFASKFDKLDILVNNAAYFNHGEDYRLSADSIELTFATNVLGPFLLTKLLMPQLEKSDDPRVLNASSNIIKHFFSPKKSIDFENLQGMRDPAYKHSVYVSYRNSKMALLMLTFKMAEVYKKAGIKTYSLQINGARMQKETLQKFKARWRLIAAIQNMFFKPAAFMARNYFEICTADAFKNQTGIHLNHKLEVMKPGPANPKPTDIWGTSVYPVYAENKAVQEQVWNWCSEKSMQNNHSN